MKNKFWKFIKDAVVKAKAELFLYEEIGKDFWGDGISLPEFSNDLKALGPVTQIDVHICSIGGSVIDGLGIYNLLLQHSAHITVYIDGFAASIASVISRCGGEIIMSDNSGYMLHDPVAGLCDWMNSKDLIDHAKALDTIKIGLVKAYSNPKLSEDEAAALMADAGTWLTAAQALELGLVDKVTESVPMAAIADFSAFKNMPANIRNQLDPPATTQAFVMSAGVKKILEDVKASIDNKSQTQKPNKEDVTMKNCTKCGQPHDEGTLKDGLCLTCVAQAETVVAVKNESTRVLALTTAGQKYNMADKAKEFVEKGKTVDEFNALVLNKMDSGFKFTHVSGDGKHIDKPFDSIGHQLHFVQMAAGQGAIADKRLLHINNIAFNIKNAASGLNENVPSEGDFLIQQDHAEELIKRTHDTGQLSRRCRRIPVSENANGTKINAVDETSRKNGSRWGGVLGYWASEAGTVAASKPKFREMDLNLKKLIAICYATEEMLQDSATLSGVIMEAFPEEFSFLLDEAIYEGSGSGQPLGIMSSPALITVPKESGQAAKTFVYDNITKIWSRCWGRSRKNAIWVGNQDIEPALYNMGIVVGTGGTPAYMPPGGLNDSPYGRLFGREVVDIEHAETLGTAGDLTLLDLSQYMLIEKGGINASQSIHVRFLHDETAFKFTYRVDGQPIWNAPLTPKKGTNTQSPYVRLASRG